MAVIHVKTLAERLGEAKHCSYIVGMNIQQLQLLNDILSVPTKTHQEERLIAFLVDYFDRKEVGIMKDEMVNLMVVKAEADFDGYFPCVVAHTDTVHPIDSDHIDIVEVYRPNTCGDMEQCVAEGAMTAFSKSMLVFTPRSEPSKAHVGLATGFLDTPAALECLP